MKGKKKTFTMDKERLKEISVSAIDKAVALRQWVSGITAEDKAVLLAIRQTFIAEPSLLDKVLPNVGPYHDVPEEKPPESHP